MTDMFEERNISYDLRNSSFFTQPILKNITYGLNISDIIDYYGAHI